MKILAAEQKTCWILITQHAEAATKAIKEQFKGANKARGRGAEDGCVCAVHVCVSGYLCC